MLKWELILAFNGEDPKHSSLEEKNREERLMLNVLYEGMV